MITLYDVIDIRTDKVYSVAIVSEKNVKWFVPLNPPVESETVVNEPSKKPITIEVSGLSDEGQETPSEEGDSE